MKLVTISQMQAIEREADAQGLSYAQMMENAGRGLAEVIARRYGLYSEHMVISKVAGLVGSGNNGGDTLVALAHLAERGWETSACLVRSRPEDDPLVERLRAAGGKLFMAEALPAWLESLDGSWILLDGVLGTGARLPLHPDLTQLLGKVQQATRRFSWRIVAVDCPSGIDCDSGDSAPECLPAELTVTMAAVKQGMLRFPAYGLLGELECVSIGKLDHLASWQAVRREAADAATTRRGLPERPVDAHKGTFGAALIVAGSLNYTGAALLAGEAAYRSGAGWVALAVPEPLYTALAGHLPEATWLLLPHQGGWITSDAAEVVLANLQRATALLLGPGWGLENATGEFLIRLLANASGGASSQRALPPLVVDADGLKWLARFPDWAHFLPAPAILTPHPGEFALLAGLLPKEIQADRVALAEKFARQWGHVVVLKGACTVVASPEGETTVIPVATPALARAGTGDVLAGLLVGLRAQGVAPYPAAVAGAWIHARAGLLAAEQQGHTASVLAGDVLRAVAGVLKTL